jgi:hypothetical protein
MVMHGRKIKGKGQDRKKKEMKGLEIHDKE